MAWRCCKACTCDDGGAYCIRDDMESCDQGGEDRLDRLVVSVKSKSEALKRGTACDGEA
jgi:phage terminase large subunit-like protein